MSEARIVLSAVDNTKAAFQSVKSSLDETHASVGALRGGLAGLAASIGVVAFAAMVKSTVDAAAAMHDLSTITGASVESLSQFSQVAKLSGTSVDDVGAAMNRLAKNMSGVDEGGKGAAAALRAIGVDFKSFQSLSPDEKIRTIAKALDSFQDGSGKSAVQMALMGKEAAKLAPFMRDLAQAGDIHAKITTEQARQSRELEVNFKRLGASGDAWKKELSAGMTPALNDAAKAFMGVMNGSGGLRESVAKLNADGTIDSWTRMAIVGLSYVADAAEYVGRFISAIGRTLYETNAMTVALVSGIAAAMTGDWTKAGAILRSTWAEMKERASDVGTAWSKAFSDETFGSKMRARMTEMEKVGAVATKTRKALNFSTATDKDGKAEADPYDALIRSVREKAAAMAVDTDATERATEAEKSFAKYQEDLIQGYITFEPLKDKDLRQAIARLQISEKEKDANEAAHKALDEFFKDRERSYEQQQKQLDSGKEIVENILFETRTMQMGNVERETEIALRALQKTGIDKTTEAYKALAEQIPKAVADREATREAVDTWKSIEQAGKQTWDNILQGGSNMWKKLRDTGKAMFFDWLWNMAAKKWLVSVGVSLGVPGAAMAGTQAAGSSIAGSAAGSVAGSSIGSFLGAGASATMSNGLVSGFGANMANIGTLMEGGSYLTALSAAAPYLAVAAAAITLLAGAFKGETRSGGQYSNAGLLQGPSGGEINGDQVRSTIGATIGSINQALKGLGSSATLANLQSGFESSKNGKGFAYAGGQLSTGQIFGQGVGGHGFENRRGSMSPEEAAAAFGEELKQATLQALQAADVPGKLGDYLRQLGDVDKLSGGALDEAITRINKALTEKQQLEARIFDLTATDAEKLAKSRGDERAAIDESNQALLDRVYALVDEKAATDAATQAAQAHVDSLNAARGDLTSAYDREKTALQSTRDRLDGFTKKFISFRDSLLMGDLSPLTPGQKYAQAASDYAIAVAQKNAGDLDALDRFDSVAQAFLEASRTYNASGDQYMADFNQVYAETGKTVSLTQMQYDVTVDQLSKLDAMAGSLVDLNTNTIGLAEAIWRLALTTPSASGTVTDAYQQLLGRAPDAGGLNYWAARLATGMTAGELNAALMASPEYLASHSHARGGVASGLSLVGEHGPELADFRAPARIYTAGQTRSLLGGDQALIGEVRALRAELQALRRESVDGTRYHATILQQAHEQSAERIVQGLGEAGSRNDWERRLVRKGVPA